MTSSLPYWPGPIELGGSSLVQYPELNSTTRKEDSPVPKDKAPWDEVLGHLRALSPRVTRLAVRSEDDPSVTMAFIPISRIAYVTTKHDREGFAVMLCLDDGTLHFSNLELGELQDALSDHPDFLRTGMKYLVNLAKLHRSRVNDARDLLFEGSNAWIENAVSPNSRTARYLDDFKARFISPV